MKIRRPAKTAIGYGQHGRIAPEGTRIATIPVGYADGIDRRLGCGKVSFLLNGHRVPTIGNICMEFDAKADFIQRHDAEYVDELSK